MNCPNCNSVNAPGSAFCVHCGMILPQKENRVCSHPTTPPMNQTPTQASHVQPETNGLMQSSASGFSQPAGYQGHYQYGEQDPSFCQPGPIQSAPKQMDSERSMGGAAYAATEAPMGVTYNAPADADQMEDAQPSEAADTDVFYGNNRPFRPAQKTQDNAFGMKKNWKPRASIAPKLFKIGAALLVLALIVIGAFAIFGSRSHFIKFDYVGMPLFNDGNICIVAGDDMLSDTIDSDTIEDKQYSLDGKVLALLTGEDELYVVKGKKIVKAANDVFDMQISTSGKGIAYLVDGDDGYELYLYNVNKKKSEKVAENVSSFEYAVSPNGSDVAYFVEGDDGDELMFFDGANTKKITDDCDCLMGVANDGKYIYIVREDDDVRELFSYNAKGKNTKLGKIDDADVCFNSDHTQVLFYNGGKSYISEKGKAAAKVSSDIIRLVVPDNCNTFADRTSDTYPVSNLYNHVYLAYGSGSNSAWLIKKNADKSEKLASKVSSVTLDNSGKYLYYIHDYEELRMLKVSNGDKAADKSVELCDDVTYYMVTPNRSKVYYVSDGCLYSVNGKKGGNPVEIAEDVDEYSLAISKKNVAYYIADGELYACSNGKKGERVLDDCQAVYNTPNGVVYASNEDTLYGTTGSKKLDKIAEIE